MNKEYRARTFKSGNSVALRLPKGLGFSDGDDVSIVRHEDGSFSLWRDDEVDAVLDGLYGSFSPGFMAGGRDTDDEAERDWHAPSDRAA